MFVVSRTGYFRICLVLFAIIVVLVNYKRCVFADNNDMRIAALHRQAQQLSKQAFKEMTFDLSQTSYYLGGCKQKLVLQGNDGNLWLFKFNTEEEAYVEELAASLARVFNLNCPEVYRISLPINGQVIEGTIQEFIYPSKKLDYNSIRQLTQKQIGSLQKQHVFDWLIYNYGADRGNFIIHIPSRKVIAVDKDIAFRQLDKKITVEQMNLLWLALYYDVIWRNYIQGKIDINPDEVFVFIDYVENIDDSLLCDVFFSTERDSKNKTLDSKQLFNAFLIRKNNLRSDFEDFYSMLYAIKEGKSPLPLPESGFGYQQKVLKRMQREIINKKQWLTKIKNQHNDKQKELRVVCSNKAWRLVFDEFLLSYKDSNLVEVIGKLKRIRTETASVYEKLAVSLYVAQLRRIPKGKNKWEYIKFVTKYPDKISPSKIKQYLQTEKTLSGSDRKYQAGALDKEDYYLLSLIYSIKGNIQKVQECLHYFYRKK